MSRVNRYIWFLIMIIIGGGVGLYYAWYVKPADFVNAALYNLRQDYKTDYVLMVAEIFDKDQDRYHAMIRLDKILDQNETPEEAVETAIRHAEGFGYNPVDLNKMYKLNEIVTGQRSTPTPQYDPTMVFSIQLTSTAMTGPDEFVGSEETEEVVETEEPIIPTVPVETEVPPVFDENPFPDNDPFPEDDTFSESDPFGNGMIQLTTDPYAAPMLNLPPAPPPVYSAPNQNQNSPSSMDDYFSDSGFSGIPDDFFGGF